METSLIKLVTNSLPFDKGIKIQPNDWFRPNDTCSYIIKYFEILVLPLESQRKQPLTLCRYFWPIIMLIMNLWQTWPCTVIFKMSASDSEILNFQGYEKWWIILLDTASHTLFFTNILVILVLGELCWKIISFRLTWVPMVALKNISWGEYKKFGL